MEVAVFGAVLPHSGGVLDRVVGIGDAVVVYYREGNEEGVPCCGDVVCEGEAGGGSEGGTGTAVVSCENGSAVLGFEDVAKGEEGALKAVILIKG